MDEETIEVAPSEESGNIPAEEVLNAPSEQTETAAPEEPVVETTTPEEEFELPDGRKVDAATLSKEWKENFYPDYTRKSQELAAKTKTEEPITQPPSKYADPAYVPTTYEEIIAAAEERAIKAVEAREQARADGAKALEDAVTGQLNEVKALDPTLNENALFLHATKYGFRDLKLAHQNMVDMREMAKTVQQTTAKNIAKRADPISASPGATGAKLDASQFASPRDYLRALKASSVTG